MDIVDQIALIMTVCFFASVAGVLALPLCVCVRWLDVRTD